MPKKSGKLAVKESQIQRAIEDYLRLMEGCGRLLYIKNNSGAMKVQHGGGASSFVRFGKKGSSDFLIWIPVVFKNEKGERVRELRTIFLEVKSASGEMSEDQVTFQGMVQRLGGVYCLVRDAGEVCRIVNSYSR